MKFSEALLYGALTVLILSIMVGLVIGYFVLLVWLSSLNGWYAFVYVVITIWLGVSLVLYISEK